MRKGERDKILEKDRVSKNAIVTSLMELRERIDDIEVKKTLRGFEQQLMTASPSGSTGFEKIDAELKKLVAEFPTVYREKILVDRYLQRMTELTEKRKAIIATE